MDEIDFYTGFSACEADTVSLSYTSGYVRMARQCHGASYVVADLFTNMLVFFMSDLMKSVNPFIDRIPRELQEQFMTEFVTELIKLNMGEPINIDDGGILFKYGLVVAFARKT